jgi:hypothetical protein
MATGNSSISLASLDFDTLKANLKNFLRTQSAFKDYDYEGSNMNVLLDVLSYNTFMNAFYLNMTASEMFLDSAQLRSSVISHAKMLNYTPRSNRSSKAVINLTIPTSNAVTFTIPKGTSFTGKNSSGNYTFTTDKTLTLLSGNLTFTANDLTIYEGSYSQDTFINNYDDEAQKFTLLDSNIDTDSLVVVVSENDGQYISEFVQVKSLYDLDAYSEVYFLQSDIDGRYQIVFGDGVFGRKPLNGAVITAEYRTSLGTEANGIDTFVIEVDLSAVNNTRIQSGMITNVVTSSSSGAYTESIESIRYNAPRYFQTQERVVTTQDYIDLITANFADIESVNAYGGETISGVGDVEYGKVYVSCSTYDGAALTASRKKDLLAFLQPRSSIGISPVIIDPEFVFITLLCKVHVNYNQTGLTPSQMNTVVTDVISVFNDDNLKMFGKNFRMSNLVSAIDYADAGILSNETTAFIYKTFTDLSSTVAISLKVDFHLNAIQQATIISNEFLSDGKTYVYTDYISGVNNNAGNLFRLEKTTATSIVNYSVAGLIDYASGIISINSYVYDSVPTGGLRIFAAPVNQDIYSSRNNILQIDTGSGVSVSVVSG